MERHREREKDRERERERRKKKERVTPKVTDPSLGCTVPTATGSTVDVCFFQIMNKTTNY